MNNMNNINQQFAKAFLAGLNLEVKNNPYNPNGKIWGMWEHVYNGGIANIEFFKKEQLISFSLGMELRDEIKTISQLELCIKGFSDALDMKKQDEYIDRKSEDYLLYISSYKTGVIVINLHKQYSLQKYCDFLQ